MPRFKLYHSILALGLLGGLSSCDKDFEEINTNPNASTVANPDLLFSQAILKGNYVLDRTYFYTSYLGAGMYVQHFANYKDASLAGMGDKYGINDLYQDFISRTSIPTCWKTCGSAWKPRRRPDM